jgi:23S rRNA (adenine-N6)-dimethyltransferase
LRDRRLVDRLVRASSLSPDDFILEIGPGRGRLTEALLRVGARVVAVEVDARLCRGLRARWGGDPRFTLVEGDFLTTPLPQEPYKVFANIPYCHTSAILRRLLNARPTALECSLIVQREAAEKFVAGGPTNSMAAVLSYPWWQSAITHWFERADFDPPPRVDSVLLRLTRRAAPLLPPRETGDFRDYVADRFRHDQRAKALPLAGWLKAYQGFARGAAPRQRAAVRGAMARLEVEQGRLEKIHRTRRDPGWWRRTKDE